MGGGHISEPRVRRLGNARRHIHALGIDRDRDQPDLARSKRLARDEVARVLEPDGVGGLHQCARDEPECALETRSHDDLVGRARHASGYRHVGCDRIAQRIVSRRVWREHCVNRKHPGTPGGEPRPELTRKRVERRQTHGEGCGRGVADCSAIRTAPSGRGLARRRDCAAQPAQTSCDVGARSAAALYVALRRQEVIGEIDRAPCDRDLARQCASRGQPVPRA